MLDAILKKTNSSFQKGLTFCRSIYVKKVMKLLAFEKPSYHLVIEQAYAVWALSHIRRAAKFQISICCLQM